MHETNHYPREAIVSWERLRLGYTLVFLGLFVYGNRHAHIGHFRDFILNAAIYALIANLFYCFGPCLDCYLYAFFGARLGRARYLLFALGLLFLVAPLSFASASDRVVNRGTQYIGCWVDSVTSDANPELWAAIANSQSYDEFLSYMRRIRPHPAPNVRVTLRGESLSREALTNSTGFAGFLNLPPGSYEVTADGTPPMLNATARVTVVQDTKGSDLRLQLLPPAMASIVKPVSIQGRIIDMSGRPIAGAKVTGRQVFKSTEAAPSEEFNPPREVSSISNANGAYELEGFEPSSLLDTAYFLMDSEAEAIIERVDIRVQADGFASNEANVSRVPLVTEALLKPSLELKRALLQMPRTALHPKLVAGLDEAQRLLPASHGNTIRGIDISLRK